MRTNGRFVCLAMLLTLAGCAERTALYKPGLTVAEARAAYDRIAYGVMTNGPLIRSRRDEARVFIAALEDFGFTRVPISELPRGLVYWQSENGLTRIAGLRGRINSTCGERWAMPADAADRAPEIEALFERSKREGLVAAVDVAAHTVSVPHDRWAGLDRGTQRDMVRVWSVYFYAKTGSDEVVVLDAAAPSALARYDYAQGLDLTPEN